MLSNRELKEDLKQLQEVIILKSTESWKFRTYHELILDGKRITDNYLFGRIQTVVASDVCNLQFTSGTTGNPKAAMLTHKYCLSTLSMDI